MMLNASVAQASSPARQSIRVACPEATRDVPRAQMQSLCLQMVQSLSQRAPGAALRRVPLQAPAPTRARDMLVRLNVRDGTFALSWQTGPTGAVHSGPTRPMDPALPRAGPAAHRAAMDDLVAATHAITTALSK